MVALRELRRDVCSYEEGKSEMVDERSRFVRSSASDVKWDGWAARCAWNKPIDTLGKAH